MKAQKDERDRHHLVIPLGEGPAGARLKKAIVAYAREHGLRPATWARSVLADQIGLPPSGPPTRPELEALEKRLAALEQRHG